MASSTWSIPVFQAPIVYVGNATLTTFSLEIVLSTSFHMKIIIHFIPVKYFFQASLNSLSPRCKVDVPILPYFHFLVQILGCSFFT